MMTFNPVVSRHLRVNKRGDEDKDGGDERRTAGVVGRQPYLVVYKSHSPQNNESDETDEDEPTPENQVSGSTRGMDAGVSGHNHSVYLNAADNSHHYHTTRGDNNGPGMF